MLLRYVMKLFPAKLDPSKYNLRNLSRVADVCSKEVMGTCTKVQGWVRGLRKMKSTYFIDVSDGSSSQTIQVVLKRNIVPKDLSYGSSVTAEGEVVMGPSGTIELHARKLNVIGPCDVADGYPFAPRKLYAPEYVRQHLHLRPRTRSFSAILRLRDIAAAAIDDYFRNRGYIKIHTPILTSNDCEGAGEVFTVKPESVDVIKSMKKEGIPEEESYFDTKAYLTVSGQLHLEAAARIFQSTHKEFYMAEAEIAFLSTIEELADEIELLIKSIVKQMVQNGTKDLECFESSNVNCFDGKFERLEYDEAIKLLQSYAHHLKGPVIYGEPLSKEQELFLVKHNENVPLFVINWPKDIKPFYMKEHKKDSSKVAALDLLAPNVGELVGGSIRETDYEKLKSKLPAHADLTWYLELRKYGNVPTGGFGLGFERFLQCVLNLLNIKDTIPFPRWPHNCSL